MEEIWEPVKGFEGYYEISNYANIKNSKGRILKTYLLNNGYVALKLHKDKVRTSHLVHRLVASTFIENNDINKTEVNHINGNKQDNTLHNLEWVTRSENTQHALNLGLYDKIYTMKNNLGKKKKDSISKYYSVCYDRTRDKWIGSIRHNNVIYYRKRFDTQEKAALHVNWILDTLGLTDRPRNVIDNNLAHTKNFDY